MFILVLKTCKKAQGSLEPQHHSMTNENNVKKNNIKSTTLFIVFILFL